MLARETIIIQYVAPIISYITRPAMPDVARSMDQEQLRWGQSELCPFFYFDNDDYPLSRHTPIVRV